MKKKALEVGHHIIFKEDTGDGKLNLVIPESSCLCENMWIH